MDFNLYFNLMFSNVLHLMFEVKQEESWSLPCLCLNDLLGGLCNYESTHFLLYLAF